MRFKLLKHIYFLGIGGIGMSSLARYLHAQGKTISGYDKTPTALTQELQSEGIRLIFDEELASLPSEIDLVVYTPAVPASHLHMQMVQEMGIPMIKRAEMLAWIANENFCIAIAGTHGKTTTTAMVADVLKKSKLKPTAFVGGVMKEYSTNLLIGEGNHVVVEADEFDRSFLWLRPEITVINSMDSDHLDIYGDDQHFVEGFKEFINRTKTGGLVLIQSGCKPYFSPEELDALCKVYRVKFFGEPEDDFFVEVVGSSDEGVEFTYVDADGREEGFLCQMPGKYNLQNASVAICIAKEIGVRPYFIKNAVSSFQGIKRRFEVISEDEIVFVDDYAHHPTELEAAIGAARMKYPNKSICGIFQPHLYSRTRDFSSGFAQQLDQLDEVILMDIYPARELPILGVTSQIIFEKMKLDKKIMLNEHDEIISYLNSRKPEVIMTLGAGDIDLLVPKIKKMVEL